MALRTRRSVPRYDTGFRPMPTCTGRSREGWPMPTSALFQSAFFSAVPKRIFPNICGNSFCTKSSTFCASALPPAHSMPA
jgi:hypothetical protein